MTLFPPETVFITARGTVGKMALNAVDMAMNQSCYALRGKKGFSQLFLFLMTMEQVDYLKRTLVARYRHDHHRYVRRMTVAALPAVLGSRFTETAFALHTGEEF
ncbi:MAG: restriction endonuclease subunit S [Thermomicrobiales bacterium]